MPAQSYMPPQTVPAPTVGEGTSLGPAVGADQPWGNAAAQDQLAARGPVAESGTPEAPDDHLGARRVGAPTSKRAALARHERNRNKIDRIMRSALAATVDPTAGADSRINLLRNTAQWIEAGEADLYVMTPTHDAHLRSAVPADQNSYFDKRTKWDESGADYDSTPDASGDVPTDPAQIEIDFADVAGSMGTDGRTMMLMDPLSNSEGDIVSFFVHEVQHDADQHRSGEAWETPQPAADPAAVERAPAWTYNSYQSEFRAYWMMNPEGSSADWFGSSTDTAVTDFAITAIEVGADSALGGGDDTTATVSTAFSNARQQDIFNHMYGGGQATNVYWDGAAWTQSYAYLPHYYALDPAFKAMVDSYTAPVSGNLINSPRIQALSTAIANGGDWEAALDDLDPLDVNYLADQAQSRPFWDQARAALDFVDFLLLSASILGGTTAGPTQETVTVVRGDTLTAIADRYLNDGSRWREIYNLNRREIGRDPNLIRPGLVLRLPPL